MDDIRKILTDKFEELHGDCDGARFFFAPGRVNLIGEYTDFNGGHVFPCALENGTYCLARRRRDKRLNFFSVNIKRGEIHTDLNHVTGYNRGHGWANYAMGMIWAIQSKGYHLGQGFDMVVYGNIPVSSGLSSSASLEVLTGYMIKELYNLEISNQEIALLGQLDENKYIGVNCGIMDQFVIAMGKKDHAIFLNTGDLSFEEVPVKLDGVELVIINSNRPRGLHDSKYNERRAECESALKDLQTVVNIKELCELTPEQFDQYADVIKDPLARKRAKHAVYEDARTKKAVEVLNRNDIPAFGKLMNESHVSLRDDFEVSGKELDTIAETAWTIDGVLGARMTGAGFGGCAVALVKNEAVENFKEVINRVYTEKIGYAPTFYDAVIGSGPKEW